MKTRVLFILLGISFIGGCASLTPHTTHYPDDEGLVAVCSKAYSLLSTSIKQANVTDAESHLLQGYPYSKK